MVVISTSHHSKEQHKINLKPWTVTTNFLQNPGRNRSGSAMPEKMLPFVPQGRRLREENSTVRGATKENDLLR